MSNTKTNSIEVFNLEDVSKSLKVSVKAFTKFETEIQAETEKVAAIKAVSTKAEREQAHKILSGANKKVKAYSDLRLDTTRPIDHLKKQVMNHEEGVINPLKSEMERAKALVLAFDHEQERKRLEELARLERQRKEREEAERKEQERVNRIKSNLVKFDTDGSQGIFLAENFKNIEIAKTIIENWFKGTDWQEFFDEAKAIYDRLKDSATKKGAHLLEMARLEAERKKAEQEQSAAAAELAAEKARQLEEQRKLAEEQARIEAQKRAQEQEKLRIEQEAQRQKEEKERQEAEAKRRKEIEAQRQKGITSGIEDIKIVDLMSVPSDLYEIKWNLNKVKAALKDGDIPGLEITFKTGLRLNG